MNVRLLFLTLATLVGGPWLIWSGFHDFQNNKRLASDGITTNGRVVDKFVRRRSRGPDKYFLEVQFRTANGEEVQRNVPVTHPEYDRHAPGETTQVRYLSSEPAVSSVGEVVPTWRSNWIAGSIMFLTGGLLAGLTLRSKLKLRSAASKIAEHATTLCETHYEYAAVQASEFSHLDLGWYDAQQKWLEEKGFKLLGDEENLTFRRTSKGVRTLLRTMIARDGAWLAYIYHFKPPGKFGDGFKILEFETQFSDNTFLATSNAEAAGKLDSPPGVDALRMPAATSFERILESHASRYEAVVEQHPERVPVLLTTLEEVHRSQNILQSMRAAFRRDRGITRAELERMGGTKLCPEQLTELHAEAEKRRLEGEQKAA